MPGPTRSHTLTLIIPALLLSAGGVIGQDKAATRRVTPLGVQVQINEIETMEVPKVIIFATDSEAAPTAVALARFVPASPSTAPAAADSVCPDNFMAFAGTTEPLVCTCSEEASSRGPVWGMDIYTGDSSICRSAVHAGVISRSGGTVTAIPEAGRKAYAGVTRNGISSSNFGQYGSSFRFATASREASVPAAPPPASSPRAAAGSICPDNFIAFADRKDPLVCSCSEEASGRGAVWGMDVYTGDSSICRSAVHAGVISRSGGTVTVIPEAGRKAYAGVTRNGISSSNFGQYSSSFRFAMPDAPVQQPIASSLKQTGEVQIYIRFRLNSAEIDPEAGPVLEELLATLRADPSLKLALIGHTDAVGSPESNMILSSRRSEAVGAWLVSRQVQPSRLTMEGKGLSQPIADNTSEIGRAINRRVQVKRIQ